MSAQTNVATESLRTLHRIHRQLDDLKERLNRGPRVARVHQLNLAKLQADLTAATEHAKKMRVTVDSKQLQLSSSEANIEKRNMQLRQAGSNVEFQALKDEIAATEMANSVLTDEILEAMEKVDEADQRVAKVQAAVAAAQKELDAGLKDIEQKKPVIEGDIARLEAELAANESGLSGEFRELYLRIIKARGEDALAPITGEYCGGCNQHVPVNLINALMLSKPTACNSCGRLLYLPEDSPFI